MRGNGGAGSGPRRCAIAQEAAGQAVPPATARLPATHAAYVALAAKHLGLAGLLPFDEGMARMGAMDSVASLTKFREDFGFEPEAFKPSFERYAATV